MQKNIIISIVALFLILVLHTGCQSSRSLQIAAQAAGDEVEALELEIRRKIVAENSYYDRAFRFTMEDFERGREDELLVLLLRESEDFADSHVNAQAERLAGDLLKFMNSFVADWGRREQNRRKIIEQTADRLAKSRQELRFEEARIRALKNRLRALGDSRSTKEQMVFLIGYSKEVKTALDHLREQSKAAAAAASGTE